MAVAPSIAVQCLLSSSSSSAHSEPLPITLPLQRNLLFSSAILFSRGRTLCPVIAAASSKRKNKKKLSRDHDTTVGDDDEEEEEEEDDAFELLFKQLEEDLKNDDLSKDGSGEDDEITEQDLALLERELEDALGDFHSGTLNLDLNGADTGGGNEQEDDGDGDEKEEEEEEDGRLPKLRTWQMKKLARALKAGKRTTSIKNLVGDLCLDRALVLELLRDPPRIF